MFSFSTRIWRISLTCAVLVAATAALVYAKPTREGDDPKKSDPKKEPPKINVPDFDKLVPPGGLDPKYMEEMRKQMEKVQTEMRKQMEQMMRKNFPGGFPGGAFPGGGGFPGGGFGGPFPGMPGGFGDFFGQAPNRLGATLQPPSDVLVDQLDLPKDQGIVLSDVRADSAAAKAGLKARDILLELGGKGVPSRTQEFIKQLNEIKTNQPVDAVVLRKGKREAIKGMKLPDAPANAFPGFPGAVPGGFPPNFPNVPNPGALPPPGAAPDAPPARPPGKEE